MNDEIHYLDLKTVCGRIGVSKSTLYKMARDGKFPCARQLGPNRVAWRSDEVATWIMARPHALGPASDLNGRAAA